MLDKILQFKSLPHSLSLVKFLSLNRIGSIKKCAIESSAVSHSNQT